MKFRAVAVGVVVDGHPVQMLTQNKANVYQWAREMSEGSRVQVQVFETEERLLDTIEPPPLEPPALPQPQPPVLTEVEKQAKGKGK